MKKAVILAMVFGATLVAGAALAEENVVVELAKENGISAGDYVERIASVSDHILDGG